MYGKCVVGSILKLGLILEKNWQKFYRKSPSAACTIAPSAISAHAFGVRSLILCNFSAFGALCLRSAAADVVVAALLRR